MGFFEPTGSAGAAGGPSNNGGTDGGGSTALFVIDPTDREEMVMRGVLTVVLNQHQELCALHKPGGLPVDAANLMRCVNHAAIVAPQRLLAIEGVLREHKLRLDAASPGRERLFVASYLDSRVVEVLLTTVTLLLLTLI